MAYTVVVDTSKRLKMINEQGFEEFEQPPKIDTSYLQAFEGTEQEDTNEDGKKSKRTPTEALEKFIAAQSELQVIVDLLTSLEDGRYLGLSLVNRSRSSELMANMVTQTRLRVGRKRQSLQTASARLREGARALKVRAQRENTFYAELLKIMRFWKVHSNRGNREAPFVVDINLSDHLTPRSTVAQAAARAEASTKLAIMRDPSGRLRMEVAEEGPREVPEVAKPQTAPPPRTLVGCRAIHERLLAAQSALIWRLLEADMEAEAARLPPTATIFTLSLSRLVIKALRASTDARLAALRPLLLERFFTTRSPAQTIWPGSSASARKLLGAGSVGAEPGLHQDLCAWLRHMHFRDYLWPYLEAEAYSLPGVSLHWVPASHVYISLIRAWIAPRHPLLLVIKECAAIIEGVVHQSTASRWARDTFTLVSRYELHTLLTSVMTDLGLARTAAAAAAPEPEQLEPEHDQSQPPLADGYGTAAVPNGQGEQVAADDMMDLESLDSVMLAGLGSLCSLGGSLLSEVPSMLLPYSESYAAPAVAGGVGGGLLSEMPSELLPFDMRGSYTEAGALQGYDSRALLHTSSSTAMLLDMPSMTPSLWQEIRGELGEAITPGSAGTGHPQSIEGHLMALDHSNWTGVESGTIDPSGGMPLQRDVSGADGMMGFGADAGNMGGNGSGMGMVGGRSDLTFVEGHPNSAMYYVNQGTAPVAQRSDLGGDLGQDLGAFDSITESAIQASEQRFHSAVPMPQQQEYGAYGQGDITMTENVNITSTATAQGGLNPAGPIPNILEPETMGVQPLEGFAYTQTRASFDPRSVDLQGPGPSEMGGLGGLPPEASTTFSMHSMLVSELGSMGGFDAAFTGGLRNLDSYQLPPSQLPSVDLTGLHPTEPQNPS